MNHHSSLEAGQVKSKIQMGAQRPSSKRRFTLPMRRKSMSDLTPEAKAIRRLSNAEQRTTKALERAKTPEQLKRASQELESVSAEIEALNDPVLKETLKQQLEDSIENITVKTEELAAAREASAFADTAVSITAQVHDVGEAIGGAHDKTSFKEALAEISELESSIQALADGDFKQEMGAQLEGLKKQFLSQLSTSYSTSSSPLDPDALRDLHKLSKSLQKADTNDSKLIAPSRNLVRTLLLDAGGRSIDTEKIRELKQAESESQGKEILVFHKGQFRLESKSSNPKQADEATLAHHVLRQRDQNLQEDAEFAVYNALSVDHSQAALDALVKFEEAVQDPEVPALQPRMQEALDGLKDDLGFYLVAVNDATTDNPTSAEDFQRAFTALDHLSQAIDLLPDGEVKDDLVEDHKRFASKLATQFETSQILEPLVQNLDINALEVLTRPLRDPGRSQVLVLQDNTFELQDADSENASQRAGARLALEALSILLPKQQLRDQNANAGAIKVAERLKTSTSDASLSTAASALAHSVDIANKRAMYEPTLEARLELATTLSDNETKSAVQAIFSDLINDAKPVAQESLQEADRNYAQVKQETKESLLESLSALEQGAVEAGDSADEDAASIKESLRQLEDDSYTGDEKLNAAKTELETCRKRRAALEQGVYTDFEGQQFSLEAMENSLGIIFDAQKNYEAWQEKGYEGRFNPGAIGGAGKRTNDFIETLLKHGAAKTQGRESEQYGKIKEMFDANKGADAVALDWSQLGSLLLEVNKGL
jgi:hypothetical protein